MTLVRSVSHFFVAMSRKEVRCRNTVSVFSENKRHKSKYGSSSFKVVKDGKEGRVVDSD